MDIDDLRVQLAIAQTEHAASGLHWALRCCELALAALEAGNYGVGAVLLDEYQNIRLESSNAVFNPRFNSAAHAEMQLLTLLDQEEAPVCPREQMTLVVSLEPCPMCFCRIISAGIGQVIYLAPDSSGGMASHQDKLPPAWRNLATLTRVTQFHGDARLSELAAEFATVNRSVLREKLLNAMGR